jgi:predicted outer membrane protein
LPGVKFDDAAKLAESTSTNRELEIGEWANPLLTDQKPETQQLECEKEAKKEGNERDTSAEKEREKEREKELLGPSKMIIAVVPTSPLVCNFTICRS